MQHNCRIAGCYSVSAPLIYENANPIRLTEPGICIDTSNAVYSALSEQAVRVEGTTIAHQPYTMKLEGSGPAGVQTVRLVGIRDRRVLADPLLWVDAVAQAGVEKLEKAGGYFCPVPADAVLRAVE